MKPEIEGLRQIWERKGSSAKTNNKGDNGHPCLTPLYRGK